MRSYYVIHPGLPTPDRFEWRFAPPLLSIGDLWNESKQSGPSLIFRVRSDSEPGEQLSTKDIAESVVGLLDAGSRWRSCFAMARNAINAISPQRLPILSNLCTQALGFAASQHPATANVGAKRQIADGLAQALNDIKATATPEVVFAAQVTRSMIGLVMADNDFEAAANAPFVDAYLGDFQDRTPEYAARMQTIETMASAVFLAECAQRLAERAGYWLYSPVPEILVPGAAGQGDDEPEETTSQQPRRQSDEPPPPPIDDDEHDGPVEQPRRGSVKDRLRAERAQGMKP